jgi:3',5'-cyclic AMP phosphodiesterase CpdA
MTPVRLVHISDLHITTPTYRWFPEDWLNKRLPAWLNLRWFGRGVRFRHADTVLAALVAELRQRRPDRVVFSGDATALGFEEEMARTCELLGLNDPDPLPGLAVPGNHDYCTRRSAAGLFEKHFAPWQSGEREEGHVYPFAQRVGHLWLIGVNSATPNRWPWDASGAVGTEQLARLRRLLARLDPGPRILVTHYPVALASGKLENRSHRLRDVVEVAKVAGEMGVGLWLHGHRHDGYVLAKTELTSFPVICGGTSTQSGLWAYNEYTIGRRLEGVRRAFDLEAGRFSESGTFELELPG